MVDGASEAAVSAVTASASPTPVTSAHLLSASSSSSSVNNAAAGGGSTIVRKNHWNVQNNLPKPSQQQRDGRHVRVQTQQQQQILPTARYQLVSGAATASSSAPERVTSASTSSTTTIKAPNKSQTSATRRQRAKAVNNSLGNLRQRGNVSSSSSSSSPSSSSSSLSSFSSSPLAMLVPSGTNLEPQADNVSTINDNNTRENVVANGYRQPASTGGHHRRSEGGESVARNSGAT